MENTNIAIAYVPAEVVPYLFTGTKNQSQAMLSQKPTDFVQPVIAPRKARMRSIPQALKAIKAQDPETAITEHYIRKLCKNGTIKTLPDGKKQLLNLDELLEYVGMGA